MTRKAISHLSHGKYLEVPCRNVDENVNMRLGPGHGNNAWQRKLASFRNQNAGWAGSQIGTIKTGQEMEAVPGKRQTLIG